MGCFGEAEIRDIVEGEDLVQVRQLDFFDLVHGFGHPAPPVKRIFFDDGLDFLERVAAPLIRSVLQKAADGVRGAQHHVIRAGPAVLMVPAQVV